MSIDPNVTLTALRKRAEQARSAVESGTDYGPWLRTLLGYLADEVEELDAHLSAGGTPPEAWREGPDAPDYTDYRTEWPEEGWREATAEESEAYLSGHWTAGLLMRESEHGVEVHNA
jgi:hypothetical protein